MFSQKTKQYPMIEELQQISSRVECRICVYEGAAIVVFLSQSEWGQGEESWESLGRSQCYVLCYDGVIYLKIRAVVSTVLFELHNR